MKVSARYLPHHEGLPPIRRMTAGASGFDICAAVAEEVVIHPGESVLVPSGLELSIPEGFEGQVRPRSGLALRDRIGILNSPGTIDSDYRGEVGIILFNAGGADFIVRRGDRIAQIVFCALPQVEIVDAAELDPTLRADGGFGHTGRE